jgi:hypothetical protein
LEAYKPYLQLFSIGELNRVGLPQHLYRKESEKAIIKLEVLSKHANCNQISNYLSQYLAAEGQEKEFLAAQIKNNSKLAHPFILKQTQNSEALWMAIHKDAREHKNRLFRNGLNGEGRAVFDLVKAYKTLQVEIKESWAKDIKTGDGFDSKSIELLNIRNVLAHQVLKNKALPEVATYFKLDLSKLTQQQTKHEYKENIVKFIASKSNFQARLSVIDKIKTDIKGHYPFIKEAKLEPKILSKYLRVTDRIELSSTLAPEEQKVYKTVLQYKSSSNNTYNAWQKAKLNPKNFTKAIFESAKRDALAFELKQSIYLDGLLMHEKADKEKLLKHSESHRLKLREIKDINEVKYTLAAQHPKISSAKERMAWKSNWNFLCKRSSFIEKNKGYLFALQDISLNSVSIKMEAKPASVLKIKKDASYLDAKLINESLMANPEQTYKTIWGEPKSENPKEMRYDGGLIVSLKGKSRGLWHDQG